MASSEVSTKAFWVCGLMALVSALVSAGFSIAGLIGDGAGDSYTLYAASRSVALPLVVAGCLWVRSRAGVAAMGVTMGLVQMFDAMIGVHSHNASKTYGPLVFAIAGFTSVVFLLRPRTDDVKG